MKRWLEKRIVIVWNLVLGVCTANQSLFALKSHFVSAVTNVMEEYKVGGMTMIPRRLGLKGAVSAVDWYGKLIYIVATKGLRSKRQSSDSCIPINPQLSYYWQYLNWHRPFETIFLDLRAFKCGLIYINYLMYFFFRKQSVNSLSGKAAR